MNRTITRSLSILLLLAMLTSLFAGTFSVSAAEYSNWGTRHEVCTELSTQAQDYYTGSYTYNSLSSKSGSSLLTALRTLTKSTHSKNTSYDNCKDYAGRSDCQNEDGTVVLLYSDYVSSQSDYSSSGAGWNREHVWPKSLGNYNTSGPGADMHHIRPTDIKTNSTRSNKRYGEVSNGSIVYGTALIGDLTGGTSNSSMFEPHDFAKGDVARICLYMHVRYGGEGSYTCSDITKVFSDINTLLEWNALDPVDTWEMGRNDVVEGIQGNRNPFIDFPELAWLLYEKDIPSDLSTPSGGTASAYTITAVSSNNNYGTVSLSGTKITATPKYGYYVAGYTVTSGSATVTQEGNIFRVNATSDCTIRINFAPKSAATVSFKQNGVVATSKSGYSEDVITLPSHTGAVPEGYAFVGWLKNTLAETVNKPATIYLAGSSYTLTSSETLYALYSRNEAGGSGNSGEYSLYKGEIKEGDYVMCYLSDAMLATDDNANDRIDYAGVTIENDVISNPEAEIIWHIAPTPDGYYTIYNAANGVYAGGTGTKSQAALLTEVGDYAKWTVTGTSMYDFTNLGNANKSVNATLRKNNSYGFGCYSTGTGTALSLYAGVTGTIYYSTSATVCSHENTNNVAAVAATCTTVGYTAGVYCNDCKIYISGHSEIAILEHNYSAWKSNNDKTHSKSCSVCGDLIIEDCSFDFVVTDPTATDQGYTTYTCSDCSYSYKDNYTDAIGYPVSITFSVPAGVTKPSAQSAYVNDTITLPTVSGTPSADAYSYKFVGWVESSVGATVSKPVVYAAGSKYTVSGTKTLYALYSYAVSSDGSNAGSGDFELLTSAPLSWTGEYVLTSANASYILLTDGTAPGTAAAVVSLSNSGISLNGTTMSDVPDSHIIVIEATGGNYALRLKGASETAYLMTSNSNSGFNTASSFDNNNARWTLSMGSSGDVVISNLEYASRDIRYNSSSKLFRTYTSGQSPVYLYKSSGSSSTTYYTTVLKDAVVCSHTNTTVEICNATCTESGSKSVVCADCGEVLSTETIAPNGHNYAVTSTQPETCTDAGSNTYTCSACGDSYKQSIPAKGHKYENNVCVNCGDRINEDPTPTTPTDPEDPIEPSEIAGRYYIAGKRSSENTYQYLMGVKDGTRYDIEDSGLSEFPSSITNPEANKVFVIEQNADGTYCIYAEGIESDEKYLGWTSGNSGTFVTAENAKNVKIDALENGLYNIHFTGDYERYLSLNATASYTYAAWYKSGQIKDLALIPIEKANKIEVDTSLKFNMNISAGAEMVVNYNFMASVVNNYTDFYLEVKKNVTGEEPIVTTYGISADHIRIGQIPSVGTALMYNAAYTGINAKEMGDSFETTLYAIDANGNIFRGETVVSSIKDFLIGKINDSSSIPELKTMAVDMLKYGAAAQINFAYNTNNLVTKSLTAQQLALATQSTPIAKNYSASNGSGVNVSTNITVRSKVELNLSCIAAGQTNPSAVTCVIADENGNILAELATENTAGVMFKALYDNVGAKEMRKVITATFYDASGSAISKTVSWSVESYVAQTREKTDATSNEIAMVNAMLTYGDSVAAYMAANG